MRLTGVLLKQHIYWHTKMQWRINRHRSVQDDGTAQHLEKMGIKVVDAVEDILHKKKVEKKPERIEKMLKQVPFDKLGRNKVPFDHLERDKKHPCWNDKVAHIFGDRNVLICGKKQAQNLTKTLVVPELPESLQKRIDNVNIPTETETQIKNSILQAHLYDAHQEKLQIKKHPVKLMWVYRRDWGITDQRKNRYIVDKLIQYCEKLSDAVICSQRKTLDDALFVSPFEKDENNFLFEKTAETLVLSKKPLSPIKVSSDKFESDSLPDIYPLSSNISINTENIYEKRNIYPVGKGSNFEHPHTAFIHYTPLDVFNYTLEPVTDDQIESRALLKAFTFAAAKAQSLYGANVKELPKPITIQCVQVHVNKFYFGVYQLNTLNLDGSDGKKNLWFELPAKSLYEICEYQLCRPVLRGYNDDVLRHAVAFYQNE